MQLITRRSYAGTWKKESKGLNNAEVYTKLAAYTPAGNVLEFGCGAGHSTIQLIASHNVLSLENNTHLIAEAKKHIKANSFEPNIHECNFLSLSESDEAAIRDFAPNVVVGWFIGGSGEDQKEQFPTERDPRNMMKLYREKIEDTIVSFSACTPSVEYIHLANRGRKIAGLDHEEVFKATKQDYDQHVFMINGFEVVQVDSFSWAAENSQFPYEATRNPNFNGGVPTDVEYQITSILAKRISQ